ncbi:MAG: LysE family translocator [Chloroflexota bacterium]
MTQTQIYLFIVTSLVIIISPGQDMILVMSRAISQGSRAGIITAAGVSLGLMGHTFLTAFGLGSLLQASEILFTVLKFGGAAYLVYLGIQLIFSQGSELELDLAQEQPNQSSKNFWTGALSNLSNPKITIFYFAYLPQFISAEASSPGWLLLSLGIGFAALTFLVKGPVGYFAGILSSWLRQRPTVLRWIDRTSGAVLILLGVRLAFEKRA